MFGLGTKDIVLIVVLLVLLFVFGSKQIPALTKSIVDSIRHLRGAFKDEPTALAKDSVKKA